jgi:hypothetical protein
LEDVASNKVLKSSYVVGIHMRMLIWTHHARSVGRKNIALIGARCIHILCHGGHKCHHRSIHEASLFHYLINDAEARISLLFEKKRDHTSTRINGNDEMTR